MTLPNSKNVTVLKEKKFTKLLPLAYFHGWNPRGSYFGLPQKSDSLRRLPRELLKIEESKHQIYERTDEVLEAFEIALLELEAMSNGNLDFEITAPYFPFQVIKVTITDLYELLDWMAQEGEEWMVIEPRINGLSLASPSISSSTN